MVQKSPTIVRAITIGLLLAATLVALPDRDIHAQSESTPPRSEASPTQPFEGDVGASSADALIEPWLHPPDPTSAESDGNPAPDSDASIGADANQAETADHLSGSFWPSAPVEEAEALATIPSTPHTPTKPAAHSIEGDVGASSSAARIEPWLHPPDPTSAESDGNPAPDSDTLISANANQAETADHLSGIIWPSPPIEESGASIAIPSTPHTPTKPATHSTEDQPLLYLTFDDGPHPVWTKRILDLLHAYGAHATFFVLGFKAERYPELIVRMAEEGHDVENHTLSHHRLDIADDDEFRREVLEGDRKIQEALGGASEPPMCLRPPFGLRDERTKERAEALGKWLVIWDIDPRDWERPGTDRIVKRVLGRVRPGAVVLFHEAGGANQTVAALDQILSHLTAEGYRFARLCADHVVRPVASSRSARDQHSPPAQWGAIPKVEEWSSAHETPTNPQTSLPPD